MAAAMPFSLPPAPRRAPVLSVGMLSAALVIAAALVVALAVPLGDPWGAPAVLVLLVAGFAAAEAFVVHVHVRREAHSFSLSEVPLVLGLAVAAPAALLLSRVVGSAIALIGPRHQTREKLAFNLASFALQTGIALAVWRVALGSADPVSPRGWAAALAATVVADLVGSCAVVAVIRLARREGRRGLWRRVAGASLIGVLTNTSFAVVVLTVLAVDWQAGWALVVVATVIAGAQRSAAASTRRQGRLEQLSEVTAAIVTASRPDDVAGGLASRAAELVQADLVEVCIDGDEMHEGLRLLLTDGVAVQIDAEHGPPLAEAFASSSALAPRGTRDPMLRAALAGVGLRDGVLVPLPGEHGTLGTLLVGDRMGDVGTFDEEDQRMLRTLANQAGVALANVRLQARLRADSVELEHQAGHDTLTDLPNRRRLLATIDDHLRAGRSVAVLVLDLDRFAEINGMLGHETGDRLLVQTGQRLQTAMPPGCLVARLGADEYAVAAPDLHAAEAVVLAEDLRRAVGAPMPVGDLRLVVEATVGVAIGPEHGEAAIALVQRADAAMTAAKGARVGVETFQVERDQRTTHTLALVSSLRTAIAEGALAVHYQPKADPRTGLVVGVEALCRWTDAVHGFVPPDEFVPLAEHAGLMGPLTMLVLSSSLRQCAQWRAAGYELGVAVNMSPRSLLDPDFPAEVVALLALAGVPATELTLELTESSIVADSVRTIAVMQELSQIGVHLSVDDLGTGYSSLSYLKRLPVDEVKIDKSFVMSMGGDEVDAAIVAAIVQLGHHLGLRIVAEGVEDEATWHRLADMGCDLAQGYWLSRPAPAEALTTWLAQRPT